MPGRNFSFTSDPTTIPSRIQNANIEQENYSFI